MFYAIDTPFELFILDIPSGSLMKGNAVVNCDWCKSKNPFVYVQMLKEL